MQRLQDLREQLRQGGSGEEREKRLARLRRFVRLARGGGAGEGAEKGQGEGAGKGEGGEKGGREGEGEGEGKTGGMVVGKGGDQKMLILQKGGLRSSPGGGGQGQGERGQGTGHDPNVSGKATEARMGTEDVHAVGLDTGEGTSRSQAIQGASGRGFRGGGYKRVYTEYRTVAEEQLHGDEIPPGSVSHVRRYFDLIRPRD